MARDGHEFAAYLAGTHGRPRGAVVILQEIYGVNEHIRAVVEQYAAAGYLCIAPALFDRIGRNIELGYGPDQREQGRGYVLQLERSQVVRDLSAACAVVRHAGRLALVGFGWGGQLAWLGAGELGVDASVAYYGTRIWEFLNPLPKCPMLLHFGTADPLIPAANVERIRAAFPQGIYHLYPAGHGFNGVGRPGYDERSAALAWQYTQEFLAQYIG